MIHLVGLEACVFCDSDQCRDPDARSRLMQFLDAEIRDLKSLDKAVTASDGAKIEANVLSCNLPPNDSVERLLRYETHIERQLDRAMLQLERAQKRRLGESVPLPARLEVDRA